MLWSVAVVICKGVQDSGHSVSVDSVSVVSYIAKFGRGQGVYGVYIGHSR